MSYSILQWREIKRGEKRRSKKRTRRREEERVGMQGARKSKGQEFIGRGLGNASKEENWAPGAGGEGSVR